MKPGDKIEGLPMPDGTTRSGTIMHTTVHDLGLVKVITATGVALCPSCEDKVARGEIERRARECGKVSVSGATDRNFQAGYEAIFVNKKSNVIH